MGSKIQNLSLVVVHRLTIQKLYFDQFPKKTKAESHNLCTMNTKPSISKSINRSQFLYYSRYSKNVPTLTTSSYWLCRVRSCSLFVSFQDYNLYILINNLLRCDRLVWSDNSKPRVSVTFIRITIFYQNNLINSHLYNNMILWQKYQIDHSKVFT